MTLVAITFNNPAGASPSNEAGDEDKADRSEVTTLNS